MTEPTMDPDSPLTEGHRWLWVPLGVATGFGIAAQVILFLIDKASC